MIKSFRHKIAEELFFTSDLNNNFINRVSNQLGMPIALIRSTKRKLLMLHAAAALQDLKSPPGNHLEKLSGDRDGQWSIRINDQYRICFRWQDGDAWEVEIIDYH
ncbi:MAG: plasmid maintenance system killer protein [Bellilinea sp.]|nr:MAG: plasmid maintenance system killer protein [Bellilinea sp.]